MRGSKRRNLGVSQVRPLTLRGELEMPTGNQADSRLTAGRRERRGQPTKQRPSKQRMSTLSSTSLPRKLRLPKLLLALLLLLLIFSSLLYFTHELPRGLLRTVALLCAIASPRPRQEPRTRWDTMQLRSAGVHPDGWPSLGKESCTAQPSPS